MDGKNASCALNVKINMRRVSCEFGAYVRQVNGARQLDMDL